MKKRLKTIEYIQADNSIGAEGCRMIREMLKKNSTLIKVNLMGDEKEKDEEMDFTLNQIKNTF